MPNPYFTLLVEDRAHDLFVYRLLLSWGAIRQRIRVVPYPEGAGSGEQHVREKFPEHLRAHRAARQRRFLIAVTDADSRAVPVRREQLERRLDEDRIPRPKTNEAVVILIPKRTVEAWLHYLDTGVQDEDSRLDALFVDRLASACREAPSKLDAWLDEDGRDGPPSLSLGRADLLRLRAAARS